MGFGNLRVLLNYAEHILITQRPHQFRKRRVVNAGLQLPVEAVRRRLPKRIAVYVIESAIKRFCEECALNVSQMFFQASIDSVSSASPGSQLPTYSPRFVRQMSDSSFDEVVVAIAVYKCRCVGFAFRDRQDFELRLGYALSFGIDIGEGIVTVPCSDEDQYAFRVALVRSVVP